MESIPEDEEIENGRQNPNLNPYTKARRRDSVCSSNSSSGQDSDSEQVRTGMSNLATDSVVFVKQRFKYKNRH